jgi:hypothetical protein
LKRESSISEKKEEEAIRIKPPGYAEMSFSYSVLYRKRRKKKRKRNADAYKIVIPYPAKNYETIEPVPKLIDCAPTLPCDLTYSFHDEDLLIDGFSTTILTRFPSPFLSSREFWNRLSYFRLESV